MAPTTYSTTISQVLGETEEIIEITFEYCQDFTGDQLNDIKISLRLADSSNSKTEDLIGLAFDVNEVSNLIVSNIERLTYYGNLSEFTPTVVIGNNQVSDGGPLKPGFNTSGGGSGEPYDVGIQLSKEGSGEGIVQGASFVLSTPGADIDAEALLDGTNWWARLQSTDGGEGSAKMYLPALDLPPCNDTPPCNEGLTPGYWKTHGPNSPGGQINDWDNITGKYVFYADNIKASTFEELIFGETKEDLTWAVPGGKTPITKQDLSIMEALSIGGGGVNALARHATAAILNARDEDINYFATEGDISLWTSQVLSSGNTSINGTTYNVESLTNFFASNNELGLAPCQL